MQQNVVKNNSVSENKPKNKIVSVPKMVKKIPKISNIQPTADTVQPPPPNIQPEVINKRDPKINLNELISVYLESPPNRKDLINEFEIRFGGLNLHKNKPISKINYNDVVKQLYTYGFSTDKPEGFSSLRIFHEYTNEKGINQMSNIRTEIVGLDLIEEYCRTNSIQKILDLDDSNYDKIKFTQKLLVENKQNERLLPVVFDDFNIKFSYQTEKNFTARTDFIKTQIINHWTEKQKTFRYLNRVRFSHPEYPVFADLSIVKSSKNNHGNLIKEYDIQKSGVLSGTETYEIEMEIDNDKIASSNYNTPQKLMELIRKIIRIISGGIQNTNYPISYIEQQNVQYEFMKFIHGPEYKPSIVLPRDFIGPQSVTLQIENIMKTDENTIQPNIRNHYTVTDKADGQRCLLFINENGKIYMIDTNMRIIFTGTYTKQKEIFESLLDGEFIKIDKQHKIVNLYAAFDIYFIKKESVRDKPFVIQEKDEMNEIETTKENKTKEKNKQNCRLSLLKQFIQFLEPISITENTNTKTQKIIRNVNGEEIMVSRACNFSIICKTFCVSSKLKTIFQCCTEVLTKTQDGNYAYNTDGLIFTPCKYGVGGDDNNKFGVLKKATWIHSFKWKPPEFNTIDFLVSIKKDKHGKDEINNIFQDGINVANNFISQYKTIILLCGFDKNTDGYLQPFQDILNENFPKPYSQNNESSYSPQPFQPTNPYNKNARYAKILLKTDSSQKLIMMTEGEEEGDAEGEYFEENMIVEFKYDLNREEGWRWVPIRVRYDKTAEFRNGQRNFGNSYKVANMNWKTIHNPITQEMITEDKNIPDFIEENEKADEGVYYNRLGTEKKTMALRDFHNLYVKRKLIMSVSNRNQYLIDYAVGKGGDLSKWIDSNLSFIMGIDISKDNIHNSLDGACARYLNYWKRNKNMPYAVFVNGNSSQNIRKGDAFATEKDKEIGLAIFGNGAKNESVLGKGIYKRYGIAKEGFHVSSCQFALHYFWETKLSLLQFVRNLTECTQLNGYFIGTCPDGKTLFQKLQNKNQGDSYTLFEDTQKIFEITKMYSQTNFPEDETCIGFPINVFQETINKTFREYLVNFNYFMRIMTNFGFVVIEKNEANKMGIPSGTGLFDELFSEMGQEIKKYPNRAVNYGNALFMTGNEQKNSFFNRYFIFRKTIRVNAEEVFNNLMKTKDIWQQPTEPDEPATELELNNEDIPEKMKIVSKTTQRIYIQPKRFIIKPK